jgi:hypothetical protein
MCILSLLTVLNDKYCIHCPEGQADYNWSHVISLEFFVDNVRDQIYIYIKT